MPKPALLENILNGSLGASVAVISDTVVQPGLRVFQEILRGQLERNERICVICLENKPSRLLGWLQDQEHRSNDFRVIDCLGTSSRHPSDTECIDVDDLPRLAATVEAFRPSSLFIDSLNALEIFNGRAKTYRFLRKSMDTLNSETPGTSLYVLHHTDVPIGSYGPLETPLRTSVLSPSFTSSLLHITLHSPSMLAHLHYSYGVEQVGQTETKDTDMRTYQYLRVLHERGWGSPLRLSERDASTAESTADTESGKYDSPREMDLILDQLATSEPTVARCVVEFAMRGIGKANKRSDAAKQQRSLESLMMVSKPGSPGHLQLLRSTPQVSDVLHIRGRALQAQESLTTNQKPNPAEQTPFNLSLTDRQWEAREATPLPYTPKDGGEILYQPDSNDDMDESDPDEDLDL